MDSTGNAVCQTCEQPLPLTIEDSLEAVWQKEWQRLVYGDVFCCDDCLQALEKKEQYSLIEINDMETAWRVDETCPRCTNDSDVWLFEKDEGARVKKCYTCHSCGCEWSEMADHS